MEGNVFPHSLILKYDERTGDPSLEQGAET
jgi:hypothetical protein